MTEHAAPLASNRTLWHCFSPAPRPLFFALVPPSITVLFSIPHCVNSTQPSCIHFTFSSSTYYYSSFFHPLRCYILLQKNTSPHSHSRYLLAIFPFTLFLAKVLRLSASCRLWSLLVSTIPCTLTILSDLSRRLLLL
ncbi:hypothetical protein BJX62DRAFT_160946 [Aspergillus germanicus]